MLAPETTAGTSVGDPGNMVEPLAPDAVHHVLVKMVRGDGLGEGAFHGAFKVLELMVVFPGDGLGDGEGDGDGDSTNVEKPGMPPG